jgi:alpha-1,3-rhamnosyl/mannosyltransferase
MHPEVASVTCVRERRRFSDLTVLTRRRTRTERAINAIARRVSRFAPAPRVDVVHGPNYVLPKWARQGVITVHDLSVFRYPETHPAKRVADFERDFRSTVSRCVHLITDCETVREEVIAFTGFAPDRVTAVPLGVSGAFRPNPAPELAPVLARYALPTAGYGLAISSLEPRKRIDRLLAAWRNLPSAVRNRYPLVVAGARGWRNDALHQSIARGRDEGWLIPLGFVAEDDLPALYAGAALFIYPSLYEGFGLPPLEAMASGVPTLVAGGTCLPEVTKGAAMVVEPEDLDGFTGAIVRGLEDQEWRKSATSAGIQVAGGYSWDRCADETVGIYQRVVEEMGGASNG